MGLDHVMILNMEHDVERYWAMLGALDTLGFYVPSDEIIRHINHNGLDYKDTKSVHEAAIADGFPEFDLFHSKNRSHAAWFWSYRCALRKMVELDKVVLLLIDDFMLRHGWTRNRLDVLVNEIEDRGFRIIQLTESGDLAQKTQNMPAVTSMLAEGLQGRTDFATILNAEGAALVLRIFAENPDCQPDEVYSIIRELGENDPEMYWGLYHTFEEICRMLCDDIWPSQFDDSQIEPWEIK